MFSLYFGTIFFLCLVILLVAFCLNKNFILNSLIILEGMMLVSLAFLLSYLLTLDKSIFLLVLSFAACEASLGLSLLVSFLRLRGNNNISSLALFSWFA